MLHLLHLFMLLLDFLLLTKVIKLKLLKCHIHLKYILDNYRYL